MKKIMSLFKRDYSMYGGGLVKNEVVAGAEWVVSGEGVATIKFDGTACMIQNHVLYRRYDRKKAKDGQFKPAPDGWIACEDVPDVYTGHWPGWIAVGDGPKDKWHREGFANANDLCMEETGSILKDWTYELVGEKINGNPYAMNGHTLWRHGEFFLSDCPRTFDDLKEYFRNRDYMEGVVWWRVLDDVDCDKVKIKRRDFGFEWP